MLGIMHEATPRGHLLIGDIVPNAAQLAALFGGSPAEVTGLLEELETAGVFSRTRTGVIYSRKMTRDEKKRRKAVENGKMGGNPTLCNKRDNRASDKGRLKTQNPESRVQSLEGGGGGSAREADLTHRERLLEAMGADPVSGMIGPNGRTLGRMSDMESVKRWDALGLSEDDQVAVVREVMATAPEPPATFRYFDFAMQRLAAARQTPALTALPAKEPRNGYAPRPARLSPLAAAAAELSARYDEEERNQRQPQEGDHGRSDDPAR